MAGLPGAICDEGGSCRLGVLRPFVGLVVKRDRTAMLWRRLLI